MLPRGDPCPEQSCTTEEIAGITVYHLCAICREHMTQSTSWVAIALRMIDGDFQEHIEMQEPEYLSETVNKKEYDTTAGSTKERTVQHRYRVIRYLDAC